jgi:hypothetical protein
MADNWYSTMAGVQSKLREIKSTNMIAPDVHLNKVLAERIE